MQYEYAVENIKFVNNLNLSREDSSILKMSNLDVLNQ